MTTITHSNTPSLQHTTATVATSCTNVRHQVVSDDESTDPHANYSGYRNDIHACWATESWRCHEFEPVRPDFTKYKQQQRSHRYHHHQRHHHNQRRSKMATDDSKEQPSTPPVLARKVSDDRQRKINQQQQRFSGNLFSLDPNVGVAVNLANEHSSYSSQQHLSQAPHSASRLQTVSERPSLLRSSSTGDMTSCGPPMRLSEIEDGYARNNHSTKSVFQDEMPGILKEKHKKQRKQHQTMNVAPNEPHPSLEFPPLYFVIKQWPWLLQAIKSLYLFRWKVSYPLQRRVPCSRLLRKFRCYCTWGELLLILPFFALVVVGTLWSFLYPSVSITGQVSRLPLIFAFATAMHNSFLTLLLGIPFERALWYHKLAGRIAFVNGILHTYVAFIYPDDDHSAIPSGSYAHINFENYLIYDMENITGTIILALVTGILITSVPYVRQKFFEFFYYTHIVFALSMAGCAFYHSGKLVPILVAATWGLDLIMRKLIMAGTRYPRKAQTRIISNTVVELRFPKVKGFDFNPGQYVYICVPEITLLQWHPFSISSSPGQKMVTLHIRKVGNWTSALHDLAQTREEISILLEGPYGSSDVDLTGDRYRMVLLLSGGIGITPMQSICNQLIYEHSTARRTLKKLSFVWIERDPIVMSDVDVVRRNTTIHHNMKDMDAFSVVSRIDGDAPLGIASTILALVPPAPTTDEELIEVFPDNSDDSIGGEAQDNFSVFSIFRDQEERCEMSQLSDEASFMENGFGGPKSGKRLRDDDTFLGAAYNETAARSPTDVLDMQIYLTSTDSHSGIGDLPFVYQGRPDISRLFLTMREGAIASGERRVAVCVCAPARVVDICQRACVKFSDSRVRFDFHAEAFG